MVGCKVRVLGWWGVIGQGPGASGVLCIGSVAVGVLAWGPGVGGGS